MSPDEMSERLAAWAASMRRIEDCGGGSLAVHELEDRRVVCVEPEGPRRTWVLYESGRQVGHARGRQGLSGEWTWEAANAGLDVLRVAG